MKQPQLFKIPPTVCILGALIFIGVQALIIIILWVNITRRKRVEEGLVESEARFRALFERMPSGVAVYETVGDGEDFVFKDFNSAAEKIEKIKREALIGKRVTEVFPGIKAFGMFKVFQRVWRSGKVEYFPAAMYKDDRDPGSWRESWVYKLPSGDVVAVYNDITARKQAEEALREAEVRYRTLVEQLPAIIYIVEFGEVSKTLYISPQVETLLGFSQREWLADPDFWVKQIHPDDRERVLAEVRRRDARGDPLDLEYRVLTRDGRVLWFRNQTTLVWDETGQPGSDLRYCQGIMFDITARKRAEEALREALLQQREAVKAANVGLWDWNLVTDKVRYSAEWKSQIGYEEHEISDDFEEWQSRVHPDDLEPTLEHVQQCIAEARQDHQVEFRFRHKDGTYRWIMAQGSVLLDGSGRPVRMLGSHVDITERKRAEEALRESEERFRGVFETSPTGIAVVDAATQRFLEANDSFLRILGYSLEELQQRTVEDVTHPDDWQMESEIVQAYLEGTLPRYEVEKRYIRKDGAIRWVHATGDVLLIDPDAPPLAIANVEDITARRQADAQLKQALAEKTALVQELYHRTRNNMQVICAMLSIYASRIADARVADAFREMEDRIHAMALAHQMLYQSQNLSCVNLRAYILDLFDHLRESYRVPASCVTLVEEMEDVSLMIDTAVPCGLVLNELFSNIFKHAFPGNIAGEVQVRLHRVADSEIELVVVDNGVGVPPGFDFRACETLGVQNIIVIAEYQMRGKITFEAAEGVTCRLRFRDDLYEERV